MPVSDDELVADLKRVAEKLGKSPTWAEYNTHGCHAPSTISRRFDGWNNAKDAVGLDRNTAHGVTDEVLLRDVREKYADTQVESITEFLFTEPDYSYKTYRERFRSRWRAVVRAGQKPPSRVPLPEKQYDEYIQTAINANYPSVSLYGLLRAFTGIPAKVLREFNSDWVSRLDSDLQATLITVPADLIADDDDWVLIAPTHYTISGEEKPTGLEAMLRWIDDTETLRTHHYKDGVLSRLIEIVGLNIEPPALRVTVAAHLARQGASRGEIEMQVGANKTDWRRSIEDYFLYLYQFEDYCHPDYDPSGVYLDPDSGDAERIESEAN
jgi:hypothetical protein